MNLKKIKERGEFYRASNVVTECELAAVTHALAYEDVPKLVDWIERARGYVLDVSSYACECSGCGEHECSYCATARQLLTELENPED